MRTLTRLLLVAVGVGLLGSCLWTEARADRRGGYVSVFGGVAASSQLFRASADASRPWLTPDGRPLEGTELIAEIDEAFAFGLRFGRGLGERLSWEGGLSFTSLDITGQHRSESTNQITLSDYDQLDLFLLEAALVYDLIEAPSTPYVLAGLGYSSLGFIARDAEGDPDMDQSGIHALLGAGYRWTASPGFAIDLDVRDAMMPVDTDPEKERLAPAEYDGKSRIHVWRVGVGFVLKF